MHHLRNDLAPAQLIRGCSAFLRHLHNPYLSNQTHMVSVRTICSMVEPIVQKDTPQVASKLLTLLLEGCIDKLECMALVLSEVMAKLEKAKRKAVKVDKTEKTEKSENAEESQKTEKTDNTETPAEEHSSEPDISKFAVLEKAKPIASATYAVEKPEDLLLGMLSSSYDESSR